MKHQIPALSKWLLPTWASNYERNWLRADIAAGFTLTVMLVPQAIAYASLAGMPPITGLYAATVALLAYAWLGTSSHVSFGPFALVSLLSAAALHPFAEESSDTFIAMAGVLAAMVGIIHLLFVAVRMDRVIALLSRPVIIGFTAAVGCIIAVSQVRDLLGVDVERSSNFLDAASAGLHSLPTANGVTTTIGVVTLALLVAGRRVLPRAPMTLVVCVAAVVLVAVLDLGSRGVATVGTVPSGLFRFQLPAVSLDQIRDLLPSAVVIALVAYAGNMSIAKAIAARSREVVDPQRELLASAAANVAAGLVGSFTVAASFSRSAVVYEARARTQLAGVVAAAGVVAVLLLLAPVIELLPRAVLAAIVLAAVVGLFDLRGALMAFRIDRADGLVMMVTFMVTLVLGAETGLVAGVASNLIVHVGRGMRPQLVVLGRVPGTATFRSTDRYPGLTHPSGCILRLDGPLNFLSVEHVAATLRRLSAESPELAWVVLDMGGMTDLDSTGLQSLLQLQQDLAAGGIPLHLATVRGPQRAVIQRAGLWPQLMADTCHPDIDGALDAVGIDRLHPLRTPSQNERRPSPFI